MFNTTTHTNATPADAPSFLSWVIDTLLLVDLRDELVAETAADQVNAAYHYGL